MKKVSGEFEVKMAPVGESKLFGHMSLDKKYHGALEGVSVGEFTSVMGEVKGSAGYVAVERVTATLEGKKGTFAMMHYGTMVRGDLKSGRLLIEVVPDSGTGELAGLTGAMGIRIEEGGKHFYDFEYSLG